MSGYNLAVADKFGFVARVIKAPTVTTNAFSPGVVRDQLNRLETALAGGQTTEHEVCNAITASASVGAAYNLAVADKFGFLARILDAPIITVEATADTSPVTWTNNPALVTAQFTGGVYSARPNKAATIYYVAVPLGDTAPTPQNVVDAKRSNGQPAIDKAFSVVASSVAVETTLSGVTYDGAGARYTDVDVYATAVNVDGVLQASAYYVGTLTVDAAPVFSGNTAGSVDNATHQVTLGPWSAATDLYDGPEALVYVALIDAAPSPLEVGYSAPGATSMTFDPGAAGNGANDYMVRARNTRGLTDTNTAKVNLTLQTSSGQYSGTTGVMRNNTNSPLPDGTAVKYSIYYGGDTNSPHTQLPDIGPLDATTAGGRFTFSCGEAGEHWLRVTDLLGNECYSGKVTAA